MWSIFLFFSFFLVLPSSILGLPHFKIASKPILSKENTSNSPPLSLPSEKDVPSRSQLLQFLTDVFKKVPIGVIESLLEQNQDKPELIAQQLMAFCDAMTQEKKTSDAHVKEILLRNKEVHSQFKDRRLFWKQLYEYLFRMKDPMQSFPVIGCSPLNLYTLSLEVG